MLSVMDTIYDVLRRLVSASRSTFSDAEIELAHEIISKHEGAAPAAAEGGGDAETHS